ncbi:bifunctional phosphoglucose/phosphomannose isomerase [Candidatus Woesearchaeota archaeon]|nr:bifunctional phosphoglucose/phosphomannose isomerase [Candidatus Woesearchaeota archaeon]
MIDKSNYLGVLENFPKQCREALALPKGGVISGEITSIVVCGMGGSAIGGDLLKTYLSSTNIPVFVNRDYSIPNFVDNYTLVFVVSYSGNTEETISAYKEAVEKKANVVAITSGGKLAGLCKKVIKIPSGLQPRAAIGYLFFPMLGLLHNSGIVNVTNNELNETLVTLKDTETFKNKAQELIKKIRGKTPIIYASNQLEPVAYRLRTQINENAKLPALHHVFPEQNHNEINAFANMSRNDFVVLMIRDEHYNERIKKRMDICRDIMERNVDVVEIHTKGNFLLARIFYAIYLVDFISYYLAIDNRVDPTPVGVIEQLKQELRR